MGIWGYIIKHPQTDEFAYSHRLSLGQCVGYPKEKLHDNSFWELTCVHLHILYSCESRGKVLHNAQSNRSLAASHSRGTKPPCWRAKSQWNKPTNKGKYHLKICMPFYLSCPSATLPSSMAVLYHVNGQQQRVYSIP